MNLIFCTVFLIALLPFANSVVYINDLSGGDQTLSLSLDSGSGDNLHVGGTTDKTSSLFFNADLELNQKDLNNNIVWKFVEKVIVGVKLSEAKCYQPNEVCQVAIQHKGVTLDTVAVTAGAVGAIIEFDVTAAFQSVADPSNSVIVELVLRNDVTCTPKCDKLKFYSQKSGNPAVVTIENRAILKSEDSATVRKTVSIDITGAGTVQERLSVSYTQYGNCATPDVVISVDHYEPAWTRLFTPTFDQVEKQALAAGIKVCIFAHDQFSNGLTVVENALAQQVIYDRDVIHPTNFELKEKFFNTIVAPVVAISTTGKHANIGTEFGTWTTLNFVLDHGNDVDAFMLHEPWLQRCPDDQVGFCTFLPPPFPGIPTSVGDFPCDPTKPANLPRSLLQTDPAVCANPLYNCNAACHNRTALPKWAGILGLPNFDFHNQVTGALYLPDFLAPPGFEAFFGYTGSCNFWYGPGGVQTAAGYDGICLRSLDASEAAELESAYLFPGMGTPVVFGVCGLLNPGDSSALITQPNNPQYPRTTVTDGFNPFESIQSRGIFDRYDAELNAGTLCNNVEFCRLLVSDGFGNDFAAQGKPFNFIFHHTPEDIQGFVDAGFEARSIGAAAHFGSLDQPESYAHEIVEMAKSLMP